MRLRGKEFECTIDKLAINGGGIGKYKHQNVAIYNALPGERVKAVGIKDKRNYSLAMATDILEASHLRRIPQEDHFLSCSPWQIMDFAEENRYKQQLTQEVFWEKAALDLATTPLIAGEERFYYRNKMEFSFYHDGEKLSLALFQRGSKYKQQVAGCILAHRNINIVAKKIVACLNRNNIEGRALKTLIIRSEYRGKALAALFVRSPNFPLLDFECDDILQGITVHYSNPQSPASVSTQLLHTCGDNSLMERINDYKLLYGPLSFFQVNAEVFAQTIDKIRTFVAGESVVDYYSGVGAISIAAAADIKQCVLVDNNAESIKYAQKNIELNALSHFTAHCERTEKLLQYIEPNKVIVLDPPRAGLHHKVLRKLLEQKPKRIVYLSCNIELCAQDLKQLLSDYHLVFHEIYNFFPAAPHIEFLLVLDRKPWVRACTPPAQK